MIRIHAILSSGALVASVLLAVSGGCRGREPGALEILPDSLVFDTVAVGRVSEARVVEWSNPGADSVAVVEVLVSGSATRDFVVAEDLCGGLSLAPGESCSVVVLFAPREAGARGAALTIVSRPETAATVALVGDGVAGAVVDTDLTGLVHAVPETLDFGAQPLGAVGGPLGIRLVNQRAGAVQFAVRLQGGQASDYRIALDRCSNETLGSGRACTIQVLFEPAGEGLRSGELILRDLNGTGSQTVPLMGTGVVDATEGDVRALPPIEPLTLSVTPQSLEFGVQDAGSSSRVREVRIRNEGASNVVFTSLEVAGNDPASFRIVQNECGTRALVPTRTCSLGIVFAPVGSGARTARVEAMATTGREPALVILGGTGVAR